MDLTEWKCELSNWHSPQDFSDKVRKMKAEHGIPLLRDPKHRFFRETQPAGDFGLLLRAQKVRLAAEDPPDFEMEAPEGPREYEVTEADAADRKRGDEIKARRKKIADDIASGKLAEGAPHIEPFPEDAWATPKVALRALEKAAESKAEKSKTNPKYKRDWGLLVFLNLLKPHNQQQQVIEDGMAQATAAAKDRFAEVWVIWEGTAYNAWRGDARGNSILRPLDPFEDTEDLTPEPLSLILRRPSQEAGD